MEIGWIAAIVVGGIAGWLAEQFMKSQMGLLMNIALGIVVWAASWATRTGAWLSMVPSVVFDVPKSRPQIDMDTPEGSVRLHITMPSIHPYLVVLSQGVVRTR